MAHENAKRLFTIRDVDIPGSLLCIVETDHLDVKEICVTCYKQGVIYYLHEEDIEHKGSPSFKPFQVTSEELRKAAEIMEKTQCQ